MQTLVQQEVCELLTVVFALLQPIQDLTILFLARLSIDIFPDKIGIDFAAAHFRFFLVLHCILQTKSGNYVEGSVTFYRNQKHPQSFEGVVDMGFDGTDGNTEYLADFLFRIVLLIA